MLARLTVDTPMPRVNWLGEIGGMLPLTHCCYRRHYKFQMPKFEFQMSAVWNLEFVICGISNFDYYDFRLVNEWLFAVTGP